MSCPCCRIDNKANFDYTAAISKSSFLIILLVLKGAFVPTNLEETRLCYDCRKCLKSSPKYNYIGYWIVVSDGSDQTFIAV